MIRKTHLAIGLAAALNFIPHVQEKFLFLLVILVSSVLPDIDSAFSDIGKKHWARPVQWVSNHRGFFHSYTFCILVTLAFLLYFPILALPFFIGYSFHLFADSFTVMGIKPFWPFKKVSSGKIVTGGKIDNIIFWVFVFIDLILFVTLIASYL